ncbi:hypothetical protein [Streptomyces bobili]|uniref:hypothetical protein n=1 Tax=Streptomyces bobili TaxID=67280 RepID=UPI0011815DD0|nr:hypothetical protein [Streptomyces bobili]
MISAIRAPRDLDHLRDLPMTEMPEPFTQRAPPIAREFGACPRGEFRPTQTAEFRSARTQAHV